MSERERVRESHMMMNFAWYKRWERDLPHRLSAGRNESKYAGDIVPVWSLMSKSNVHYTFGRSGMFIHVYCACAMYVK